jgi:hypothetical protein
MTRLAVLSLILLASCASPSPSATVGCDWAYTAASLGDCGDKTIFCDDLGSAVILCDGYEIDSNAPCAAGADGYPELDYDGCIGAINRAFGLVSAGSE